MWEGFGLLSSERPSSMGGMTNIPFRAMLAYAKYAEMTRAETEDFVSLLSLLDRIMVDRKNSEAAK